MDMKEKLFSLLLIIVSVLFIPIFFTTLFRGIYKGDTPIQKNDSDTILLINYNNIEQQLKLNDYLVGVVAAEMPVNFEEQALKAQAVAARTYTLKKVNEDPQHVFTGNEQAYKSNEELESLWGSDNYLDYYNKIRSAVVETYGEVIEYDNALIDAVFHSTSSGKTRNAVEAWGRDVPYLLSVDSAGDMQSPQYLHSIRLNEEQLAEKIKAYEPDFKIFTDNLSNEVQIVERAPEGYVQKIQIGNKLLEGEIFRNYLDLPSSHFTLEVIDNEIEIDCKGYGHGVGMSQYGANYLAGEGYDYKEILMYYYSGTTIQQRVSK